MSAFQRRAAILGLIAVALASIRVSAAELQPMPGLTGMVLDLDTNAGSYSVWRTEIPETVNAIETTTQVHRLGHSDRWAPAIGISVRGKSHRVTFQIVTPSRKVPLELHLALQNMPSGTTIIDTAFATHLDVDEKLSVTIYWTQNGLVTASLANGESVQQSLGEPAASLEFANGTSEVKFDPLLLGHLDISAVPASKQVPPTQEKPATPALTSSIVPPQAEQTPDCEARSYVMGTQMPIASPTVVSFRIKIDGSVEDVEIAQSSGDTSIDHTFAECVGNWRYKPATQNGQPVEVPWRAEALWSKLRN